VADQRNASVRIGVCQAQRLAEDGAAERDGDDGHEVGDHACCGGALMVTRA
jgi:hypothetical protein